MKRILFACILLFVFICVIFEKDVLCWDNEITHKDLSSFAADNSILSGAKGDYLLRNIGFKKELLEEFTWNNKKLTVKDWLRVGADFEDFSGRLSRGYVDGKSRSFNHFHNPLKPWTQAGLDDWIGPLHFTGKSSLLWTQDGSYQENFYEGNWSWDRTREYFYIALTGRNFSGDLVASDEEKKRECFARTFRGLGHQMHLLQDTAVPDHVRNDAHPEDSLFRRSRSNGSRYFEEWTKEVVNNLSKMMSFAANPVMPNVPMNVSLQGLAPITQLYDADWYDGLNASAGINQGLAEYTNANFFSGDTIFAAERYPADHRHYFPFPRRASTDFARFIAGAKPVETVVDQEGNTRTGIWISKVSDGEDVSHLVRTTSLTRLAYDFLGEGEFFYSTFYKDEICHGDYTRLLIPRAVGYSAELLDYFFRGNIDISLPLSGIYSSTNDANTGFTRIALLAENKTSNGDEMNNGTIELVVKYKAAVETSEVYYKTVPEADGINVIPVGQPVELTFDFSGDPLPVGATDVYLQVVYHGKLGNEDGAVAVGFKDISEPTPIDIFNNMDKICISDGTTTDWYYAGSQTAIDRAPGWDIYPHNLKLYIKFYNSRVEPDYASPSSYDYLIENIPAGTPMRALYALGDENLDYSYYPVRSATDSHDLWDHIDFLSVYNGGTVRNQEGDYPGMYIFRNFRMWPGSGFIYVNAPYPDNNAQCPLSSL